VEENSHGTGREEEKESQVSVQKNKGSPSSSGTTRRPLRILKPFNPSFGADSDAFPNEEGEKGLFNYIIGYISRSQDKNMVA
jgi:hypothetical protein